MKTKLSFVLFFVFLFCASQEIAYKEPFSGNCKSDLERIDNVNFDRLFDIITEEKEFKEYLSANHKILFLQLKIGKNYNNICEKNICEKVFKKIWNKTNFNKLQKKSENRIIIPVYLSQDWEFIFEEQTKQNNFFTNNKISNFHKGKLIEDEITKEFYYYSNRNLTELIIRKENKKISQIDYLSFAIAIEIIKNQYIIQLQSIDEQNNYKFSNAKSYKYENGNWIFLEEYK